VRFEPKEAISDAAQESNVADAFELLALVGHSPNTAPEIRGLQETDTVRSTLCACDSGRLTFVGLQGQNVNLGAVVAYIGQSWPPFLISYSIAALMTFSTADLTVDWDRAVGIVCWLANR